MVLLLRYLLAGLVEISRMCAEEHTFAGLVKIIRISYLLVDTVFQAVGCHSPKIPARGSWIPLDLGEELLIFVSRC